MSELLGIARFTFHPGKVADFKRLSEQCMAIVRDQDTGTLQYEQWNFPVMRASAQSDVLASIQLTFHPNLTFHK